MEVKAREPAVGSASVIGLCSNADSKNSIFKSSKATFQTTSCSSSWTSNFKTSLCFKRLSYFYIMLLFFCSLMPVLFIAATQGCTWQLHIDRPHLQWLKKIHIDELKRKKSSESSRCVATEKTLAADSRGNQGFGKKKKRKKITDVISEKRLSKHEMQNCTQEVGPHKRFGLSFNSIFTEHKKRVIHWQWRELFIRCSRCKTGVEVKKKTALSSQPNWWTTKIHPHKWDFFYEQVKVTPHTVTVCIFTPKTKEFHLCFMKNFRFKGSLVEVRFSLY